jgi:hypothetical protein
VSFLLIWKEIVEAAQPVVKLMECLISRKCRVIGAAIVKSARDAKFTMSVPMSVDLSNVNGLRV